MRLHIYDTISRHTLFGGVVAYGSACSFIVQVTAATREGDTVKLTVEPAKGGDSETLEADVVLVSAGCKVLLSL